MCSVSRPNVSAPEPPRVPNAQQVESPQVARERLDRSPGAASSRTVLTGPRGLDPRLYGTELLGAMTSEIQRLDQRWQALKTERDRFRELWQGIAKLCAPRSGRFLTTERNQGKYKHSDILNESGLFARRILAAGLMSGLTSPSRPWFELATEDQDRSDHQPHAEWLRLVRDEMLRVFRISNTYTALFSLYSELGPFGTGAAVVDEHFERVIHVYPQTVGQYAIATDEYGMPNALWREFEMTVEQIVRRFVRKHGWGVVSPAIKTAYDQGNYDHGFDVRHAIRPRSNLQPDALNGRRFPVQSVYWDPNHSKGDGDIYLDDTGFEESPLVAPRWDVIGNDVYGYGCGEDALGTLRSLQAMEKDYQVAIAKMARPPSIAPVSLRDQGGVRSMPGGITYAPDGATDQVKTLENFQPRLAEFNAERQVMAERTYHSVLRRCRHRDIELAAPARRRRSDRDRDPGDCRRKAGDAWPGAGADAGRAAGAADRPDICDHGAQRADPARAAGSARAALEGEPYFAVGAGAARGGHRRHHPQRRLYQQLRADRAGGAGYGQSRRDHTRVPHPPRARRR